MDYASLCIYHSLEIQRIVNECLLNHLEQEADFLVISTESGYIDYSRYEIVSEGFFESVEKIVNSILEFFKGIFGSYKDKAKVHIDKFNSWYKDNKEKLDKIPFDKISISVTPYWEAEAVFTAGLKSANDLINMMDDIVLRPNNENIIKAYADKDNVYKNNTIVKKFVDKDNNLLNGSKNYFRLGNPNDSSKRITVAGDAIKKSISQMVDYCSSYNEVVSSLDKAYHYFDTYSKKILNELKTRPKTESFCILENVIYSESSLNQCINAEIILELVDNRQMKEPPKEQEKSATNASEPNKTGKPEAAKVIDTTNKEEVDSNKMDTTVKSARTDELKALQNVVDIVKTIISAAMTIGEEKFVYYFNLLKELIGKSVAEEKPTETNEKKETPPTEGKK